MANVAALRISCCRQQQPQGRQLSFLTPFRAQALLKLGPPTSHSFELLWHSLLPGAGRAEVKTWSCWDISVSWSQLATGSLVCALSGRKAAPLAWVAFRWVTSGQYSALRFSKLVDPALVLVNECKALLKFVSGKISLQRMTDVVGLYSVHAEMLGSCRALLGCW